MELTAIGYDGRVFRPVDFAGGGEPPSGRYSQRGDLVWAEFSGAHVRAGHLIGRVADGGRIDAAYCQVLADGRVQAGRTVSTPERTPSGRLRLIEHWRQTDGTTGVSEIEEVTDERR